MSHAKRRCLVKCIVLFVMANFILWMIISRKSRSPAIKWKESGLGGEDFRLQHPSYHGDGDAGVVYVNNLRKVNSSISGINLVHEAQIQWGNRDTATHRKQFLGEIEREIDDERKSEQASIDRSQSLHPPEKFIINPHNFAILINEPAKCMDGTSGIKPVFLLVLVMTDNKNFRLRKAVRETWGSVTEIDGKNITTMFLLGSTTNVLHRQAIGRESAMFHDILLEDFVDSYKNLTLKTIMGLKWATKYCSHASYVMKTDDDMFVSYENLVRYLKLSRTPSSRFVTGRSIHEAPIRDPTNKWYVPPSVYDGSMLPPFCSGTGYVMSGDVVPMVVMTSLYVPYLHLEDVFIGLCLERLNIRPLRHIQFNNGNVKYSYCRYKTVFTAHLSSMSIQRKYEIWRDLHQPKSVHCNIPFWPGNDPIFA